MTDFLPRIVRAYAEHCAAKNPHQVSCIHRMCSFLHAVPAVWTVCRSRFSKTLKIFFFKNRLELHYSVAYNRCIFYVHGRANFVLNSCAAPQQPNTAVWTITSSSSTRLTSASCLALILPSFCIKPLRPLVAGASGVFDSRLVSFAVDSRNSWTKTPLPPLNNHAEPQY